MAIGAFVTELTGDPKNPKASPDQTRKSAFRDPIVWFTAGLFIATVFSVVVFSLQWLTLEKTDETNRVGLRPYISGVGINVDTERYPLYWAMTVSLENSGGTPPLEMQYVIRSAPEFPLDPEDIFQRPSETDAFFWNTISPKGRISINGGKVLSTFLTSSPQTLTWYLIGSIHYRDEFRGTPEHISKFCFGMVAVKDFKTNTMRPAYDACPYWNCVDQHACNKDRERYDQAVKAGFLRPTKKSTEVPNVPVGTGIPHFPMEIIKALP